MNRRTLVLAVLLIAFLAFGIWNYFRSQLPRPGSMSSPTPGVVESLMMSPVAKATPTATPFQKKTPPIVLVPSPVKPTAHQQTHVETPPILLPPPVVLHKELIPKDIEIVRVYYAQSISGPGASVEFDINGTGFTAEFERMIEVQSGNETVDITGLKLITLNQIHGVLVVQPETKTGVVFPQVLINKKIVFRAPDPFAVIRPNEVLNVVLIDMDETGRAGRFRVFTNLTQDMFAKFAVEITTPTILTRDVSPTLPFVVDFTVGIGNTPGGSYGLKLKLDQTTMWERDGMIRVIQPNVGESGLIQNVRALDGFSRPGDEAHFEVRGSGFRAEDGKLLRLIVPGFDIVRATFAYVAPGRLDLILSIPGSASVKPYDMEIRQGTNVILKLEKVFQVVGPNWARGLKLEPALVPGGKSSLILEGRDFDVDFIESMKVEFDIPELTIGAFRWESAQRASAELSAAAPLVPGDYVAKMTSKGKPVTPHFGNVIKVNQKVF